MLIEYSQKISSFEVIVSHNDNAHNEDSGVVNSSSQTNINSADILFNHMVSKDNGKLSATFAENPYTFNFKHNSEQKFSAVVVDGATSSLINGCDPSKLDENGNPTKIPEHLLEATNVSLFSRKLSTEVAKQMSENPTKAPIEIYKMSITNIGSNAPYKNANVPLLDIKPSATISMIKENGAKLEGMIIGDQTVLIGYKDGTYDMLIADKAIKRLEEKRKDVIKTQHPEYDSLPKDKQKIVRSKVMKEWMRTKLGKEYYVPYSCGSESFEKFVDEKTKTVDENKNRKIEKFGEDVVTFSADKYEVDSVVMSSDGFVERALKYKLSTPEKILKANDEEIKNLKEQILKLEDEKGISHDDMTLVKIDVKSNIVPKKINILGARLISQRKTR
ncbi:MAG: hypothetical protein BWY78_00682 [Alphaproteobacteria bacterium ADurb.Bin438]|nr:MAG: hypothetical protein BWY78_00682 [Alphaproteobacteria bacterium ADurb.Bin438]